MSHVCGEVGFGVAFCGILYYQQQYTTTYSGSIVILNELFIVLQSTETQRHNKHKKTTTRLLGVEERHWKYIALVHIPGLPWCPTHFGVSSPFGERGRGGQNEGGGGGSRKRRGVKQILRGVNKMMVPTSGSFGSRGMFSRAMCLRTPCTGRFKQCEYPVTISTVAVKELHSLRFEDKTLVIGGGEASGGAPVSTSMWLSKPFWDPILG